MNKMLLMTTAIVSGLALSTGALAADGNTPDKIPGKTDVQVDVTGDAQHKNNAVKNMGDKDMKSGAHVETEQRYRSYTQTEGFAGTIVGGYSADELIGTDVVGPDGDTIGEIADLLIGADDKVQNVLVDVGGFLGIGEKRVALDLSALTRTDNDTFATSMTQAELEARAAYRVEDDGWFGIDTGNR